MNHFWLFQFTGLIRGPTAAILVLFHHVAVSIHRPHTRPDRHTGHWFCVRAVSIHRPHTRPDRRSSRCRFSLGSFNSQASYEARRPRSNSRRRRPRCFNSQASYEARLLFFLWQRIVYRVSIHRPHTRPDRLLQSCTAHLSRFNSQASYEARRPFFQAQRIAVLFQFTGLIRGPTCSLR